MVRTNWLVTRALVVCLAAAGAVGVTGCAVGAEESDAASELRRRRTDAQVQAEIERAADGAVYISEADIPYTWVGASGRGISELTEEVVIQKLGDYVDNPDREELHAKASPFASFFEYENCDENSYPGPEECAKDKILHDAIKANLKKVKVFYVAPYENPTGDGAPTIFIIGFTPEGNIGGVMTSAVWT